MTVARWNTSKKTWVRHRNIVFKTKAGYARDEYSAHKLTFTQQRYSHPIFTHKCFWGWLHLSVFVLYSSLTYTPCFCFKDYISMSYSYIFLEVFLWATVRIPNSYAYPLLFRTLTHFSESEFLFIHSSSYCHPTIITHPESSTSATIVHPSNFILVLNHTMILISNL
jgi:hypothetical protein